MTKNGVSISKVGQIETLTGQAHILSIGNGETNPVVIPLTIPGKNRFFLVESAALYITDNNVGGTLSIPYPPSGVAGQPTALGFIVPAGGPSSAIATFNGLEGAGPPSFTFTALGPAVEFLRYRQQAGPGTSLAIWAMNRQRRVIVPQGYVFVLYIQDPGDAAAHDVTATLIAQVRWFDLDECEC